MNYEYKIDTALLSDKDKLAFNNNYKNYSVNSITDYNFKASHLNNMHSGSQEKPFHPANGCIMLSIALLFFLSTPVLAVTGAFTQTAVVLGPLAGILLVTSIILLLGLFSIPPNEGRIVMFCGKYLGTIRENGFLWTNPFYSCTKVSFRLNIFETDILKVNDLKGNPIQIGAVIIWKISNSAKSMYDVQNLNTFVRFQSDSAVRKLASSYPYDHIEEGDVSLKDGGEDINTQLVNELQSRLVKAGVIIEEAKLNRLNYSEEIAQVMLRRQQAEAIISARQKIINGAVGIVGMALESLNKNNICDLSKEERGKLASNLLVVLCSENHVNPIVNAGS